MKEMTNKISISYCICCWNEHVELSLLLKKLMKFLNEEDEIVIQGDQGKVTDEVVSVVRTALKDTRVKYVEFPLNKDFSTFKNNAFKHCEKDYIYLIDPDEIPHPKMLENLKFLLFENTDVDVFRIPRINIVQGLNSEYSKSQGWNVQKIPVPKLDYDSKEILSIYGIKENNAIEGKLDIEVVNPFDWQSRLLKNHVGIKYINPVHEVLTGYKILTDLPTTYEHFKEFDFTWCLFHVKKLERQKFQNNFYQTIK